MSAARRLAEPKRRVRKIAIDTLAFYIKFCNPERAFRGSGFGRGAPMLKRDNKISAGIGHGAAPEQGLRGLRLLPLAPPPNRSKIACWRHICGVTPNFETCWTWASASRAIWNGERNLISRLSHGVSDAIDESAENVGSERSSTDLNVRCQRHSRNKSEGRWNIDKVDGVDGNSDFVVGRGDLPVVVRGEGAFADPSHRALRRAVLGEIEGVDLDRDRIAGSDEADIARGDLRLRPRAAPSSASAS